MDLLCLDVDSRRSGPNEEPILRPWRQGWRKLLVFALLSVLSYSVISRFIVTAVEVSGTSMQPTLFPGERLILNRLAYLHREPARGDLIVLRDPESGGLAVKRIIGLPGDQLQLARDRVYLNNCRLDEPYLLATNAAEGVKEDPIMIAPEHYFVLGDNRANSADSRVFGPIQRRNILGVITR